MRGKVVLVSKSVVLQMPLNPTDESFNRVDAVEAVPMPVGAAETSTMHHDIMTSDQVADLLQISRDTVYHLASRGELRGRKVGRVWRFLRDEVEKYIRVGNAPSCDSEVAGQGNSTGDGEKS